MALVAIDAANHDWNLDAVAGRIRALGSTLLDRARSGRQKFGEITGRVSPDNPDVAGVSAQYSREEEFRSALDAFIAGYRK